MVALPLAIIFALTAYAIKFGGSMGGTPLLGVSTGVHDTWYFFVLAFSLCMNQRRKSYHKMITWFVCMIFVAMNIMQIIDPRGPAEAGSYNLYMDHLLAVLMGIFLIAVIVQVHRKKLKKDRNFIFFSGTVALFVTLNLLLVFDLVRDALGNFFLVYDTILYSFLYLIVLSTSQGLCEFLRSSADIISDFFHRRRVHLR